MCVCVLSVCIRMNMRVLGYIDCTVFVYIWCVFVCVYVQVLQRNIQAEQSTIDNLNEKAQTLKNSSHDENLSNQITQVIGRYELLGKRAKVKQQLPLHLVWLLFV